MIALLSLVLLAAAPKLEPIAPPPKIDKPKLQLELPEVPKAEGLSGSARQEEAQPKQTAGDLRSGAGVPGQASAPAKLVSAVHARDFRASAEGHKPLGRIDSFTVPGLPARIAPFKTCLRLRSPSRAPAMVKASLRSPAGEELLSSRAEVSFSSNEEVELVVDWDGFQATRGGDYHLVVLIDGAQAEDLMVPVEVR